MTKTAVTQDVLRSPLAATAAAAWRDADPSRGMTQAPNDPRIGCVGNELAESSTLAEEVEVAPLERDPSHATVCDREPLDGVERAPKQEDAVSV